MSYFSIKDFTTGVAAKIRSVLVNTDENLPAHIIQDSSGNEVLGTKADAKSTATDVTPVSAMSVWKQISASIQAIAAYFAGTGASALTTTQNALSTAAEVVIAANTARRFAEVKNTDATISMYIGKDNTVTSGNGHLLKAGESFGFEGYTGAIWMIAASATPTVTTIEW